MSVNFPAPTNDSINPASLYILCSDIIPAGCISLVYKCTYVFLILPLSVAILCLGFQQWKCNRSSVTAMSHSDFFTYNMAVMELIGVSGAIAGIIANITDLRSMKFVELQISFFPWNAQMLLPLLTCVERYLAVVWPITYMTLGQERRLRIRNISTGLIWLMCFAGTGLLTWSLLYPEFSIFPACIMVGCLITVTFCSLSVLWVLICPRPGKVGQGRMQVDQSKQKAFKTVIVILGVLFFRFGGNLVCYFLFSLTVNLRSHTVQCMALACGLWFTLPSSLVLPLLFLHRTGKIPGCKQSTESG